MKFNVKILTGLLLATSCLLPLGAWATQAPVAADSHTNSALPTYNFGSLPTLSRTSRNQKG